MSEIKYKPIGIIHSPFKEVEGMPIQPTGAQGVKGMVEVLTDDEIPRILSCLDSEEGSLGLSESLTDASTACNIATPIRTRNPGKTIGLSNLTIHHWEEHYGNQKRQGKRDLGTEIQNS